MNANTDIGHQWPPGTVTLEDLARNKIIRQPQPSDDPEQPLNWSAWRKTVNFSIVCFYSLMSFVLLDIGTVIWTPMNVELGVSYANLNNGYAANCAGLAVGCILLVPIAILIGRRPLYLVSTIIQFGSAIWQAKMETTGDVIGSNILSGLAGAASESIVQMTISDMFFVHQRATMNAIYLAMVTVGGFLAPVAAGYAADAQGWRWIWWWTAIFLGVAFLAILFGFEETKYTQRLPSLHVHSHDENDIPTSTEKNTGQVDDKSLDPIRTDMADENQSEYPKKSLHSRFAFVTRTPGRSRSYLDLVWSFVYLLRFPAVAYTAIMYGTSLAWFSIILTTLATYFAAPPYNFSSSGIGLLNLAPFIGSIVALVLSASNDWIIVQLSKRNKGIFEPEMRLWLALVGVLLTPAGMLLFGLTMAEGYPWIIPCVGSAIFGFGFSMISDVSLTYLQDCYNEAIGSALVPVAFVRNGLAMMIVFVLTPWIESMGLSNMFICASALAWACYLTTIPMILWGRKWREQTANSYEKFLLQNRD